MPTVLTIAGFDPSSGAGVTADLMVFAAHGLFGTSCITSADGAVDGRGCGRRRRFRRRLCGLRCDVCRSDLPAAGIKIGMLATAANVKVVVEFLEGLRVRW